MMPFTFYSSNNKIDILKFSLLYIKKIEKKKGLGFKVQCCSTLFTINLQSSLFTIKPNFTNLLLSKNRINMSPKH